MRTRTSAKPSAERNGKLIRSVVIVANCPIGEEYGLESMPATMSQEAITAHKSEVRWQRTDTSRVRIALIELVI